MNNVSLIGRLGADPELKSTPAGTYVCEVSLAVQDREQTQPGGDYVVHWIRLVLWSRLAEVFAEHSRKGMRIGVEGKLVEHRYEKDGQTRTFHKVKVKQFTFCDSKNPETERATEHYTPRTKITEGNIKWGGTRPAPNSEKPKLTPVSQKSSA